MLPFQNNVWRPRPLAFQPYSPNEGRQKHPTSTSGHQILKKLKIFLLQTIKGISLDFVYDET